MISDVKCNPTIDQRTGYTSLLVFEKIFPRIAVIEQMFNDMTAATIHSNAGRILLPCCMSVCTYLSHINDSYIRLSPHQPYGMHSGMLQ